MDTYIHIWEYKGYPGFHHTQNKVHETPKYLEYLKELRPLLRSRESDLMQEFNFWGGTAQPHEYGGIFELRTYDLYSGKLLEWEQHWRKGLEFRKQVMEPVGAWFTHLGRLNRVHHLWQFADLEHRKISRQKSWEIPGWADTVCCCICVFPFVLRTNILSRFTKRLNLLISKDLTFLFPLSSVL